LKWKSQRPIRESPPFQPFIQRPCPIEQRMQALDRP
jgi:hypothetical protein